MAFLLSPGVNVSEIDLTTVVPVVATSIAAYAGNFRWGPVEQILDISDEVDLVNKFGRPDDLNYISFFSAANFLAYSGLIRIVRSSAAGMKNASNATPIFIKNDIDFENNWLAESADANTAGPIVARFPGALGNSIKYSMIDANTTSWSGWSYAANFTSKPGTSNWVSQRGGANDEIHLIVIDEGGAITGTPNSILEKYEYLSRATDAKRDDGSSNYWANVINNGSRYIRWVSHPRAAQLVGSVGNVFSGNSTTSFATSSANLTIRLAGGVDGTPVSGNVQNAYSLFSNSDEIDISLIITGNNGSSVVNYCTNNLAEIRKDCMVFASPEIDDVIDNYGSEVNDIISTRNTYNSSSYTVMDSGWKYQYDKYNDVYRYVPLNADIAGLCAKTDADREPWFSPGGLNRGFIKNIVRLPFNPSKAQRDLLYINQVNPVVTFTGQGTVLFGDKTLQVKPSAFDRINVRRLFIILEKAIAEAAKYSLFEFNDAFTRNAFEDLVVPYLRDIQGRRGITDFRVVCDRTNNTPEIIDRNEFVGDIYIKPTRSINFIQLNFVATRTGVSFQEVVGKF